MASPTQIIANQKNASLSTGPRTPDGKAVSARNATKHGLSSAFTVLAHEDQSEFDRVLQELRSYYRPQNIVQAMLVDQMAQAQWFVARARRLQTVAYNLLAGVEDGADPDTRIVTAMQASNADLIGRLERYAAAAERSFQKAYRELTATREKQIHAEAERIVEERKTEMLKRLMEAPPPAHPACANPSIAVRNEANLRRPTDAELAFRL
jgi:hypothetical protein